MGCKIVDGLEGIKVKRDLLQEKNSSENKSWVADWSGLVTKDQRR